MNELFSGQAATFLALVVMGFALGVFYDILRVMRGTRWIFLWDMVFWIISALFVFVMLLQVNFAQLRFFTFLGVGLGLVLHFFTLSRLILKTANFAKRGLQRGVRYGKMKVKQTSDRMVHNAKKLRRNIQSKKKTQKQDNHL